MKLCFLLYFLFFQQLNNYRVVNTPDKVYVKSANGHIKQGQYISKNDSIGFENPGSILRVMNNEGVWEISKEKNPLANRAYASSPLWRELKNLVIPVQVKGKMQSRSGSMANLTDVEQYFNIYRKKENALLIIDSLKLPLTFANFKDTSGYFFYISYTLGTDTINKRIPALKTKQQLHLLLDRKLFFVDGVDNGLSELGPVVVWYRDVKKKSKTWLSVFYLRQIRLTDILEELNLITNQLSDPAEISETLLQYLSRYYGLPDMETFRQEYLPLIQSKINK